MIGSRRGKIRVTDTAEITGTEIETDTETETEIEIETATTDMRGEIGTVPFLHPPGRLTMSTITDSKDTELSSDPKHHN